MEEKLAIRYYPCTDAAEIAKRLIKEDLFPLLQYAKFVFATREPTEIDSKTGLAIIGKAKPLSAEDRDIFGFDFKIILSREVWDVADDHNKERIIFHELNHCEVLCNEEGGPLEDKVGRIKIHTKGHDININTFDAEINRYGAEEFIYNQAKGIVDHGRQSKASREKPQERKAKRKGVGGSPKRKARK